MYDPILEGPILEETIIEELILEEPIIKCGENVIDLVVSTARLGVSLFVVILVNQ